MPLLIQPCRLKPHFQAKIVHIACTSLRAACKLGRLTVISTLILASCVPSHRDIRRPGLETIIQHPKNIDHTCLVRTISAQPVVLACAGQQIECRQSGK
jgi:hypothetical protein